MQMTEREKRFLELAEEFQQDYCLLRDEVVNTQFLDLSDDLYEKVHVKLTKYADGGEEPGNEETVQD